VPFPGPSGQPGVDTKAVWDAFRQDVAACQARLLSSLRETLAEVQALASGALEQMASPEARRLPDSRPLDAIARLYHDDAETLLSAPLDAYRRLRPLPRTLNAFDAYERSIDQVIRALPDRLSGSGFEWLQLMRGARVTPAAWLRLRLRRHVTVSVVPSLLLSVAAHRKGWRALEGRLLTALANMSLELAAPWQVTRRAWFATNAGAKAESRHGAELALIRARLMRHHEEAGQALTAVEEWLARTDRRIASFLTARAEHADETVARFAAQDDRRLDVLGRQCRAVDASLELEARLAQTEASIVEVVRDVRGAVEAEHGELLAELGRVASWLGQWRTGDASTFPPAAAHLVPAVSRVGAVSQSVDTLLRQLPESAEVSAHLAARLRLRQTWTIKAPRAVMSRAVYAAALPLIGEGVSAVERRHQAVVLEIERAREVVSFARETARSGPSFDQRIEQEGIANARALVEFQREQLREIPPAVDQTFLAGLLHAFESAHSLLDDGRFGVLQQAARYGVPQAARTLRRRMQALVRAAADTGVRWTGRVYRSALVGIGWVPAPPARGTHVVTRGSLTGTLGGSSTLDELPMIYQRLFRLVPVEDPRFLVGRQEELAAVADARALWEQGRDAGVLLVGARGSGKTSLINCALQRVLPDLETVRSEFVERLTTADEVYGFLSQLLGVAPPDLDRELTRTRRVIVLEELERTFLRRTHGFAAVRALLGLIARTSRRNLWIVSVNHASFRLLNASLPLQPHFSHRINAMAVERAHMRQAILMRHHLSGLRLRFAPPMGGDSYARRILQVTGMRTDPESEFFDALFRESGGVFRTAFALWHRYIDRAEAGVLHMNFPTPPEYDNVMGSLGIPELFTLAALQQHGSLTPAEHAVVFQIDETTSRARLDNLLARELIEPDPGRYGLRVVPDAVQIVRQTLFRRNIG